MKGLPGEGTARSGAQRAAGQERPVLGGTSIHRVGHRCSGRRRAPPSCRDTARVRDHYRRTATMHTLIETTSGDLRVLLLENIHATALSHFSTDPRVRLTLEKGAFSPEQLIERIKGVHVLGIRSKTHVTPEVIAAADELLAIGCFCIGTNQVALDAANA